MNGKTIIFGMLIVGIGLIWDSFRLPYNYFIIALGAAIIIFGFLSKKTVPT